MKIAASAVVLASALLGAGCVLVPLPQPRAVLRERPGGALRPIERLGRWDGARFVAVDAGSVPASHLVVMIHGWAPGWGRDVLDDPTLRAWDAGDADRPFEPWMQDLARVITAEDPYAIVLVYSWLDDAATGRFPLAQRRAFAHTELHGGLLARALGAATERDFTARNGQIHLIGHSFGARIATLGAIAMPVRPRQITIFDSPDATVTHLTGSQTDLATPLRQLPIGSAPGRVFVDNYIAMVGRRYEGEDGLGELVDVALAPPYGALDYRHRHLYPMRFYAQTAGRDFGRGWSPFIGRRTPVPGCYAQTYGEVRLERGCGGMP